MNKEAAREIFGNVIRASMDFRLQHGEIPMSFILVMPDDRLVQVPALPGVDAGGMAYAVRSLSETVGARYVVSTGEAWVTTRDTIEGPAPSEAPDRVETIMVTIDGPDLQLLGMVEINPDGTLGEPRIEETIEGRFTNLSGMVGIN